MELSYILGYIDIPWLQRHRLSTCLYTVAVPFKRLRNMVQSIIILDSSKLLYMAIHVLVIYGNEMCTQLVKSVLTGWSISLYFIMLIVAVAMEGEPRNIECKLHLINNAVIWNACQKVHFHLWWLCEESVKNNKHFQSSYGASFAVETQQNGVQSAYKDMYNKAIVKNCHFTQYCNKYSTQSKSQWLHEEHTHKMLWNYTCFWI